MKPWRVALLYDSDYKNRFHLCRNDVVVILTRWEGLHQMATVSRIGFSTYSCSVSMKLRQDLEV